MSKPFDATLNALIDVRPEDWANGFGRLAGIPPGPSVSLDTDLATTLTADRLFRINGPRPAILHLEFQSSSRLGIPRELMRYNTLVDHTHDLPVHSMLVLLRPRAVASDQDGRYERFGADGQRIAEFRYHVERVWDRPVDFWLNAGIGLSPLAVLTEEAMRDPEAAIDRFHTRLTENRIEGQLAESLVGSTFVLCGLRHDPDRIAELFRRMAMLMEESTTYQWILDKGRTAEARRILLQLGTERFGPPPTEQLATLQSLTDAGRLTRITGRVLKATDWADLLKTD